MIFSQTICVLSAIQKHSEGISFDELREELRANYFTSGAVHYLLSTDSLHIRLESLSPYLEVRNGRYFFIDDSERFSNHDLTDSLLREKYGSIVRDG